MMTDQRCSRSGCWLLACKYLLDVPEPKFLLGQSVKAPWTDEFGIYRGYHRGIVTGLRWNPPEGLCKGWWVQIEWHTAVSFMPCLPWVDDMPECDLEPDS